MAIINGNRCVTKEKIKAVISADVAAKITAYCQWANIDDIGFFIEEAACFVFSKDKDWQIHERAVKRAENKETHLE